MRAWGLAAALACALGVATPASAVQPEWAAVGSALLPGVGQMVNGDYVEGSGQVALYFVLANQYIGLTARDDYMSPTDQVDSRHFYIRTNKTTFEAGLYGTALTDLSFYSAFAAYRDARNNRGNVWKFNAVARVDGVSVAEATYAAMIMDRAASA